MLLPIEGLTLLSLHSLLSVHIVWLGAIGIHVLAYLRHIPTHALADWMRGGREAFGRRSRRRAVVASLLTGAGVALIALPLVAAWHR